MLVDYGDIEVTVT